jgi:hypothetical protein
MKFPNWTVLTTAVGGMLSNAVSAHPGHAHIEGIVHGLSWSELMVYLLVAVVVPGATWAGAWLRDRRASRRRR